MKNIKLIPMKNNLLTKNAAFTLVESVFVLFVYSFFLTFSTLFFQGWQQRLVVEQFLSSLEKNLLFTQQMAVVKQQQTKVSFSSNENCFYFMSGTSVQQKVKIPEELTVEGPALLTFKEATGNTRIQKYTCTWIKQKKVIVFQFQLGSGKYVKKIHSL